MRILSLVLVSSFFLAACATTSGPRTRETPAGTVELFKFFEQKGDRAGQWDILSPDFKRRLSDQAGRNVDLADYEYIRNASRSDPRVRAAEEAVGTVSVQRVRPQGPNRAAVTVNVLGKLIGKNATIGMVRLEAWELTTVDDPEPYWGIVGDPLIGIESTGDGGYVVWTRATPNGQKTRMTFPASQVKGYRSVSKWYVDDLGGLEEQFMQ